MFGRGVLDVPDGRRILLVGLLMSVARWMEMLAFAVLVWERTESAFLVAMMTMLRLLPMGMFGAVLGVLADRMQRRSALLLMLSVHLTCAAVLSVLALGGMLAVWHMAVASFITGAAWAADNPVRRMMLGEVVGTAVMARAVALDLVANTGTRIAGPVLGGALLAMGGMGAAVFLLSLALHLAALPVVLRIDYRSTLRDAGGSVLRDMRQSFGLVLRAPGLAGVMLVTVIYNLFAWPLASMVPVIGSEHLRLAPEGVGLLAAMDGIGALFAALALVPLLRPAWFRLAYVGSVGLYCAMAAGFALTSLVLPAAAALLLMGVASAGFAAMQATLVYALSPPDLRSRALGVLSACIGLGPIGFLHLGGMAHVLGAPMAMLVIGVEGLCALLVMRRWLRG